MVRSVNRFEANLISILYGMLGERPIGASMLKIVQSCPQPECLSRDTIELIQQALAKGVSLWLTRSGGWRVERYLRDETPAVGRLWQRTSPSALGLEFSAEALNFLVWLTASEPLSSDEEWKTENSSGLTLGDQVLLFRAIDALRHTPVGAKWFGQPQFALNPLVSLHFPDFLTSESGLTQLNFASWMRGTSAAVLECLQTNLATRWVQMERAKSQIHDPSRMIQLGKVQQSVLDSFANAAEASGRRDLCRFLLMALSTLTTEEADARTWIQNLKIDRMRFADRTTVYNGASTLLVFAKRLRRWAHECASIGYFDDGYAAAQLWLGDWERYDGEIVTARAAEMVRRLTFRTRSDENAADGVGS